MKYFAKYLPVEGEPKEIGDCYEIEKGSIGKIIEKTSKSFRFRTKGLTGYFKDKIAPDNILSQKKVKLFLCSNDLKEGDTIQIQQYNGDPNWNAIFKKKDGNFLICEDSDGYKFSVLTKDAVKIIGEISKDAIWVTEGMEFDEEDWDFHTYKDYYNNIVQIKCPTCKIFH